MGGRVDGKRVKRVAPEPYPSASYSRKLIKEHSIMPNEFVSVIKPTSKSASSEGKGRSYPVLPVRDTVLFPHAVLPLTVGRESSIQLIQSLGEEKAILVVAQRDARQDDAHAADLHH